MKRRESIHDGESKRKGKEKESKKWKNKEA